MKPVFQTRFGKPDGNCLAACLASLLEIDIDSVPSFGIGGDWYDRFTTYMVENWELQPIDLTISENSHFKPAGFHLINGPSINGDFWHSVVGYKGEIVHDPFPNTPALKEAASWTLFIKV